jgi:hypothetical protein
MGLGSSNCTSSSSEVVQGEALAVSPAFAWKQVVVDSLPLFIVLLIYRILGERVRAMEQNLEQMISQLYDLSKKVSERRNEILKFQSADFIRSFVDLTQAIEQLDSTRELLLGRAESMLSRPNETERKLRKEHLKLVHSRK